MCQRQRPRSPAKQRPPKHAFDEAYLMANGTRGERQLVSGGFEAEMTSGGFKHPQSRQRRESSHLPIIDEFNSSSD